jgi:hypothetical protein
MQYLVEFLGGSFQADYRCILYSHLVISYKWLRRRPAKRKFAICNIGALILFIFAIITIRVNGNSQTSEVVICIALCTDV